MSDKALPTIKPTDMLSVKLDPMERLPQHHRTDEQQPQDLNESSRHD